MTKNYKQLILTYTETILSTFICAIGVCLYIEAGIGSDTIDVLVDGIHQYFSITIGQADMIYSLVFLLLAFLLNRKYIGIPTIVNAVLIGIAIDMVNQLILPLQLSQCSMYIRLLSVVVGQICFAISYAIFQTIQNGMHTLDACIYYLVKKFHISYITIRIVYDIIITIIGYALGGVLGIGTIISMLTTGVMTQYFYKKIVDIKKKKNITIPKIVTE